jgi:hypothetical protein
MIVCPKCGHQNLPSYPTCSRCGTSLSNAAAISAQEDLNRLMQDRARITKRNRVISLGLAVAALGYLAFRYVNDRQNKGDLQTKLDQVGRWVELEKRETGAFWNCVMASEVDIGQFQNAGQIQQRIEAAYFTQQKTFSEHLMTECVPKLESARAAFGSLEAPAPELRPGFEQYKASLPELKKGIELYAERIRNRGEVKDVDQLIQQYGDAWHSSQSPTPETIAFERFIHCAIPGLEKMKDAQGMLEFLADACYKKDPVSFMDRARKDCGPILATPDPKAKPSKTYALSHKRFYEEEARQLSAWDSCSRRARKGKKVEDLGEFLIAVGEYMNARTEVGKTARGLTAK